MAKAKYYGNLNRRAQARELQESGKPARNTQVLVYDEDGAWCGKLAITPETVMKIRTGELKPLSDVPSKRGSSVRRTFDVNELANANDPYHNVWLESEKLMTEAPATAGAEA